MAEALDDYHFTSRGARYPWREWCDGRIWRITQGVDFEVSVETMRDQIYARARLHGWAVKTSIEGDESLVFKVIRDDEGR